MPHVNDILAAGKPVRSPIIEGTIVKAPASFDDALLVQEPWGEVRHTVKAWSACHGSTLPEAGAACVLTRTNFGSLVCLWWEGEQS